MKEMIMNRMLICFLTFSVLSAYARAEDAYQQPPSYDQKAKLEDIWAIAEIVVVGTTAKQAVMVEEALFGKSLDLTEANPVLSLGIGPTPQTGNRGVWFLLRGPDGYAVLNPDCEAVAMAEFRKLRHPKNHWTSQTNLVVNRPSKTQVYHSYTKPNTKDTVWHGTDVSGYTDGDLRVELKLHGQRQLWLMIGSTGSHKRIAKYPEKGLGFYLEYHKEQLVEFCHYKDRKRHGVYRRYFTSSPKQLREEKNFTDGVVDGRWREWEENGKLIRDDIFRLGFIPPVVQYKEKGTSGVTLYRSESGVTYSTAPVVRNVKVGMTTQQVSDLLKVDFSPSQGLMFPTYLIDQYLFIGFKDEKVSEIRTGHNGVCVEYNP